MPVLATTDPDFLRVAINLLGGLAIFLFGMGQMTDSLKAVAGSGLGKIVQKLTTNRFKGALTGSLVTAVVNSSSVTTVLLVGFITAGLMTLQQSVPVIMGANVGSTITAQIVAFNIYVIVPWLVSIGFGMYFISKKEKVRLIGLMIMGLGMVFFGMQLMGEATMPLRDYPPFVEMMRNIDNPFLAMLVSAAFTGIIQSSAATTGIVIMLAGQGFINLEAGIALALGSNIGTCVTAVLAAVGKPIAAVRAAAVHIGFNVIGVLIWLPLIGVLASVVRDMSDGLPRQIANAHTVFNVANTFLFIWFTGPIARLAERLVPEKPEVIPERAQPKYLDDMYFETPSLAVERVRLEAANLGDVVLEAMDIIRSRGRLEDTAKIEAICQDANLLHKAILSYTARLGLKSLGESDALRLEAHVSAANDFQAMGDTIVVNLGALGRERRERDLVPSEQTHTMLKELFDAIAGTARDAVESLRELDLPLAEGVIDRKGEVNEQAAAIERHIAARLAADDPRQLATYRLEIRAIEIFKRLYYFAKRVAKLVAAREHEVAVDDELAASDTGAG